MDTVRFLKWEQFYDFGIVSVALKIFNESIFSFTKMESATYNASSTFLFIKYVVQFCGLFIEPSLCVKKDNNAVLFIF